jgi:hypothetical protein
MPNDKIEIETDRDPLTKYEDTSEHDRKGMLIGNPTERGKDDGGTTLQDKLTAPQ